MTEELNLPDVPEPEVAPEETVVVVTEPVETTYQERVLMEAAELEDRFLKLKAFVNGSAVRNLSPIDQQLLRNQCGAMATYLDCLKQRIARF